MGRFRNTAYVINEGWAHFDAAYAAGLTAVHGRSNQGRSFALGIGPIENRPQAVDFVRCPYLSLDNHPVIVVGATEAIEVHRCCTRTRLNFDLMAEPEATMSAMFSARVIAFSRPESVCA